MATWKCEECGDYFKRDKSGARSIRFCGCSCYQAFRKRTGYNMKTPFKAGMTPWNKGMKGIHLSPATEFKKGMRSRNKLPVGSETIRIDKNGRKRTYVKTRDPNTWKLRCVKVWEDCVGPIPTGLFLHHCDHDTTNDALENLCLTTRNAHIGKHRNELLMARVRHDRHPGKGYVACNP